MFTLSDRTFAVTGAARGIGAGVVEAILEAGGAVALIDVNLASADRTANRLDPSGTRTMAVAADVTNASSLDEAADSVCEHLGPISGWVNNAGIVRMGPAQDISANGWDLEIAVNARGVLHGSQTAFRIFQGRGGAIVNIASNAGKVGFSGMAAYNASKAAVINLTRSLAKEWADHSININAVCPGSVATPMLREVAEELARDGAGDAEALFASMVPEQLKRHVEPLEVGRVIAFLLSDAAVIIRGQSINVDGGETPY